MNKAKRIAIAIFTILLFAIAVPIAINELYKHDVIYVTKWEAADVLSYYGTLLGATVTILTLVYTISFTRKQIQREHFLERNRLKWETVEAIIMQALLDISPLNLRGSENMDDAIVMIHNRISRLQSYALTAKTSLDKIKCHINPNEYKQVDEYVAEISSTTTLFCEIQSKLEKEYMALQTIAVKNNGVIPNEEIILHLGKAEEIVKDIPIAYNGPYQRLLDRKRDVFEKIYADIDEQADRILRFSRKK